MWQNPRVPNQARQAHETAVNESKSAEEALEAARAYAAQTTEKMREKSEEIENLRIRKSVDDRERAVRARELTGEVSYRSRLSEVR